MSEFDPDYAVHPRWHVWEHIVSSLDLLEEEEDALQKIIMECGDIDKKSAQILDNLFGMPAHFWLNLQSEYNADKAHGRRVMQ